MELPPIGHYPSAEWFALFRTLPEKEQFRLIDESLAREQHLIQEMMFDLGDIDLELKQPFRNEAAECIAKAMER